MSGLAHHSPEVEPDSGASMIGLRVEAVTTTQSEQRVTIDVTAIESTTETGLLVWGYRVFRRRASRRGSLQRPGLYFIPDSNRTDPNGTRT